MRKSTKAFGFEPASLTKWKRKNVLGNYDGLTNIERQDIRYTCTKEQFYLCAYCCKRISGDSTDCMNEHVVARKLAPHRSLDFNNIVASCRTPNQCDSAHGSQVLPLTPFDTECESDIDFSLSGRVKGLTDNAKQSIQVLNLGNKSLVQQRKQFVQALLLGTGVDPDDIVEDDDLLQLVIDDLSKPNNGRLEAFSPIAVNVLKNWIS